MPIWNDGFATAEPGSDCEPFRYSQATYAVSAAPIGKRPTQSARSPGGFWIDTLMLPPDRLAVTREGGVTTMAALVARSVVESFSYKRTKYVPAVIGATIDTFA